MASEAGHPERQAVRQALLPPLSFASRDDFKNVARLTGLDGLVDGVVSRAGVDGPWADALRAAANGFDGAAVDVKRQRIQRLLELLQVSARDAAAPSPTSATPPSTSRAPGKPETRGVAGIARPATSTPTAAPGPTTSTTTTKPTKAKSAPTKVPPTRVPARLARPAGVGDPNDVLATAVSRIRGVGPTKAAQLMERGLETVGDVLLTLPRTYEDRRETKRIADVEDGSLAVISGTVQISGVVGGGRGRRFEASIDDGSGQLRLVFFHFRQGELVRRLERGQVVTAVGEVKKHQGRISMIHPRLASGEKQDVLGGIKAVYPELKGLHPLELARVADGAVDLLQRGLPDPLPSNIVRQMKLPALATALTDIHRPKDDLDDETLRALVERRSPAHRRLAFEELFVLGIALALRRRAQGVDPAASLLAKEGEADAMARLFPFAPTGAQVRAAGEILRDLEKPAPMARLLQGDVGAGKTAVAAMAALRTARAGFQTAFMAPTEILAEQHGRTLKKVGFAAGLRVEVITGSVGKKARTLLEARLRNRDIDVVVGTQALLSEGVRFAKLGLCIVDEQHRFGVVQRALLRQKGPIVNDEQLTPHLLVMTATPIPRSLTLTVYGDLSVSILDELPPGRTPVKTTITDLHAAVDVMRETLARNERAFVVYPLIEETESNVDIAAATAGFDDLRRTFGDADVGLLHGKMSSSDKDAAMSAFARGEKRVLVSTTVIEVGVDVPQATLMVIVNAERFGLAQLHQLRGRVGRSSLASGCLLVPGDASNEALERLRVLEATNDGFRIAEKDLELRGPGDVLGTRQSGLPALAFADVVRHAALIESARELADDIVAADPELAAPDHVGLRRLVFDRYAERLALTASG